MVHPSFKWSEMLWTGNDRLLHVSVLYCDNPSNALSLFDEASSAVETSVGHTALLTTVKDDSHTVSFFVLVHDTSNVQAASLVLSSSQNASGSDSLTL